MIYQTPLSVNALSSNSLPPFIRSFLLEDLREIDMPIDEGAVEDMMTSSPTIFHLNNVWTDVASHAIVGNYILEEDLSTLPGPSGERRATAANRLRSIPVVKILFQRDALLGGQGIERHEVF